MGNQKIHRTGRLFVLAALMVGLAIVLVAGAQAVFFNEVQKPTASDAQLLDNFGLSSSLSGNTALVGAFHEDGAGNNAGAAYVYQRDQGGVNNWGEVTKVTASNAGVGDLFGFSVGSSGDTAVVGAVHEDGEGNDAGAAYVFQRNQGGVDNWGQVAKLTASDAEAFDYVGFSAAISGDTIAIGAPGKNGVNSDAGAVYIFQRNQGGADNWGQVAKLTASDAAGFDFFAWSVAVDGDSVVVGAIHEDDGGDKAGAAYVFGRDQGGADNWGQVAKLTASDAQPGDIFGFGVAASGNIAVVGAVFEDAGGPSAGAAYVFERDQGGADNWGQVMKLTASDAQSADFFGLNVAVSGDTAVVGAHRVGAFSAGAAYVFQRHQGGADNWGELTKLTASDAQDGDDFGRSVAVSGDTVLTGANSESGRKGAAYVFELQIPKPTPTETPTPSDTPTPTDTPTATPCAPEGCPTATPTPTPGGAPEMELVLVSPPGVCVAGKCQLAAGAPFKLGVQIVAAPAQGYVQAQSYVWFGPDLTWDPGSTSVADDLVWPDCVPGLALRFQAVSPQAVNPPPASEVLAHGCATGLFPPLPVATHLGLFATMILSCSPGASSNLVQLLPSGPLNTISGTSGSVFTIPPNSVQVVPLVSNLTINCVTGG
ncbi:MAG: FG-GAP repeat protein [Chloroflexi bacterium]|nr:FG-GAP repeat protein [Chloroflexota bacterium]